MSFEILTMTSCRWSIRAMVALGEKPAGYRLVDVSQNGRKAPWYDALTPFGKTPALRHADRIVVESRVINEYIEEVAPGRKLLPRDPLERAWARIWNAYCDEELMRYLQVAAAGKPAARRRAHEDFRAALERLDAHVFYYAQPGAFWGGPQPSLTDICYWSLFDVLERTEQLQAARRLLDGHPRLGAWSRQLLAYPAFAEASALLEALPAPTPPDSSPGR
ncbi:MAG: glutathione S-transferase family protein [Steroidobacteraceae bacterium]